MGRVIQIQSTRLHTVRYQAAVRSDLQGFNSHKVALGSEENSGSNLANDNQTIKNSAIVHIKRASKLLAKLNGTDKRHSWVLDDIVDDLKATLSKRA